VEAGASITRNAALSLAGQLLTAAVTAGLTLYLARALGPEEFGVFSLALAVSATLMLVSEFGVSQSAARFTAEHRGEPEKVAEVLASALRLKLFLAGGVCVALALAAGPIADGYDEPGLDWALRGMALALFGQNLMALYGSAFTALALVAYDFRIVALKSVVEAAGTVALVVASAGATEAAFGRAAGFLAGGVFALVLAARKLGRESIGIGVRERLSTRRIAGYAGALFIIDGAFALFQQVDVLLIGAIISATAAGLFLAPLRLISLMTYPALALANGVAPRLAGAGREAAVAPFMRGIRILVVFQALMIPPIVVWAEPIVDLLLGGDYAESAEVLRGLAPFVFLMGIGTLLALGVNYLGEARRRVPIAIATVTVNIVLDLILLPEIGIVGGAIATDVAFSVYVGAHFWICNRMLGIDLRAIGVTFLRALLAAGAMAGVLVLFGVGEVAVPLLLAGLVCGTLVFLAVLVVTREITRADVQEVRSMMGRARG
jgi:stage V sporulation protein B